MGIKEPLSKEEADHAVLFGKKCHSANIITKKTLQSLRPVNWMGKHIHTFRFPSIHCLGCPIFSDGVPIYFFIADLQVLPLSRVYSFQ